MQESQEFKHSEFVEQGTGTIKREEGNLNEEALESALKEIDKEQTNNQAKIERYKLALPSLYKELSSEERIKFLENPVNFCSEAYLFRGLPHKQVIKLLETKAMLPQPGAFASDAVFTTNSPFAATDFIDAGGGLIMIDRSRVSLMSSRGIYDAESSDFFKMINETLAQFVQNVQKRDFFYTIMNHYDTSERMALNRPWRTIALRKKQSLDVVKNIIVVDISDGTVKDFDLDHIKPEDILTAIQRL